MLDDGRPAGPRRARRGLAGERGRPLPARSRPATRRRSTRTSRAPAAASPTTRAATGSSRSSRARTRGGTTRTPGGPAHIHFSIFGRAFTAAARHADVLPGRPALRLRPDLPLGARPAGARAASSRASTSSTTEPEWALGYRWDIVLGAAAADADGGPHACRRRRRPSGRSSRSASADGAETDARAAGRRRRRCGSTGACSTARATPVADAHDRDLAGRPSAGWAPAAATGDGRQALRVRRREAAGSAPARRRTSTCSSSRAACSSTMLTRIYFPDERGERRPTRCSSALGEERARDARRGARRTTRCASTSGCRASGRPSSSRCDRSTPIFVPRRLREAVSDARVARGDARRRARARGRGGARA